jgi:hypothetical protein
VAQEAAPQKQTAFDWLCMLLCDRGVRLSPAYACLRQELIDLGLISPAGQDEEIAEWLVSGLREDLIETLVPGPLRSRLESCLSLGGKRGLLVLSHELGCFVKQAEAELDALAKAAEEAAEAENAGEAREGGSVEGGPGLVEIALLGLHQAIFAKILDREGLEEEALVSYRDATENFAAALGVDLEEPEPEPEPDPPAEAGPRVVEGGAKILPFRRPVR